MFKINPQSLQPLQFKEFRYFITARFFLVMGLRMLGTAAAYKLFHLTQSSFSVGLMGLCSFIPVFLLALYAGYIIDRSDKRTLLMKSILWYSLCVVGLILITTSWFQQLVPGLSPEILFYILIFFGGTSRAFMGPATQAIISQLVPKNMLQMAAPLSSSTMLAASITGHASAGFFIAWFGINGTFIIVLGYVLIAAFLISRISKKAIAYIPQNMSAMASVKEGLNFVFTNKIMLGAICLDLFAVLFGGAVALIPEFANKILAVGPIGFGWLNAAMDIGSVATILLLTFNPLKKKQGYTLLYAVAGFGICIILFALSTIYWLSFVILLMAGVMDGISVIIRSTIIQLTTPDDKRGRVSSVNSLFINSSNELGQFESGFMAKAIGTVPSVVFGGTVTLLVTAITWIKAPSLRKFEY